MCETLFDGAGTPDQVPRVARELDESGRPTSALLRDLERVKRGILQRADDYTEILERVIDELDGCRWFLVRKGRPAAQVKIVYAGPLNRAAERYEKEAEKMRQGLLALIGPGGGLVAYRSEPMVRARR